MDSTIYLLKQRIEILESIIVSLLSTKHIKLSRGFNNFAKVFRQHVRSSLFIHSPHITPTNSHILKELSAIWNDISFEEKLHWILHV